MNLLGSLTGLKNYLPTRKIEMNLNDITIRTELKPGDMGYVIYMHGKLYKEEYDYGLGFESYVAQGLHEFYEQYDSTKDRVWICEHENNIIGFMVLMHRPDNTAQLRYFLLHPDYRGIGLGKKLMQSYMENLKACKYNSSFLVTTKELSAAASLYMRNGFKLVAEKPSNAFGKPVIEQRYELVVN